jgi:Tol biopolymer transport system component
MTLAWTQDGKWLIVPSAPTEGKTPSLVTVSPETLETRPLTGTPPGSVPDCCPALSEDGRTLAFLRAAAGGRRQIFLLSLDSETRPVGEPKELTSVPSEVVRPTWVEDGKALLYLTSHDGVWTLWRAAVSSGQKPTQVALLPPIGNDWSVSSKGDLVAFTDSVSRAEVWRMDLKSGGKLSRFISSSRSDSVDPQYSPDGSKLAYQSLLLGETSIIVADSEGTRPITVATGTPQRMSPLRWSPDGTQLTYECVEGGNVDICAVPATGGSPHRVTQSPARDSLPSWSHDGKSIYFTSDRSGTSQIWKIPVNGTDEEAVQLTHNGGFGAVDSPEGSVVYYVRQQGVGALFRIPAGGGEEIAVGDLTGLTGLTSNLALTSRGIYYPASDSPEQWVEIWHYPFKSRKPVRLARLDTMLATGMSVSPDDHYLLFSAHEKISGDIYMVKNPR